MKARIVVIEDDADLREAICLMLRYDGYEVFGFSNGKEAIRRIEDGLPVDVILLDLMMPIMTGWEFCEYRAGSTKLASVPVIIVTARQVVAPPIGVKDVLLKPFGPDELQDALARALTAPEAR
jgi:two-component system, chemotaxis family, chemotaxis protein CheY